MLVPVLDDLLGGDRPDSLDLVELVDVGHAEADRAVLGARGGQRIAPGAELGDHDLLSVAEAGREIDGIDLRSPASAAGALDGVGDPRSGGKSVDTRPADRTGNVHDYVRAAAIVDREGGAEAVPAVTRRAGGGLFRAERARADQQQGDRDGSVDEDLGPAQLGHAGDARGQRGAGDAQNAPMPSPRRPLFSIGHSTHAADRFLGLLERHAVGAVADVRRFPASRRHPQFGAATLEASLSEAGIAYVKLGEQLGGRRGPAPGSPNDGWRVSGFRAYADHMASHEFADGLAELERLAAERPTAVMCAEADWRRCHRRLVADCLLARGWEVLHVLGDGRLEAHEMTPFAQIEGVRITYPDPQRRLLS